MQHSYVIYKQTTASKAS